MSDILFRSLQVAGPTTKVGKIDTDEYGYGTMVLGAIGGLNSKGEYYECTREVMQLFDKSSILQQQVQASSLYGENGHPNLTGMNEQQAMSRFLSIQEPNVCTHFRNIYLDPNYHTKSSTMRKGEIAIIGELKPYGDKAEVVNEAFKNPHMNLSYSVRCLSRPKTINGTIHRTILSIITWDKVYMGGIKHAVKANATITKESAVLSIINDAGFTSDAATLGNLILSMQENPSVYTTESMHIAKGVFDEVTRGLAQERKDYNVIDNIITMFKSI